MAKNKAYEKLPRLWRLEKYMSDEFRLITLENDMRTPKSVEIWRWNYPEKHTDIDIQNIVNRIANAHTREYVDKTLGEHAKRVHNISWTPPRNSRVCPNCYAADPSVGATKCPNCDRNYDGSGPQDESALPFSDFADWCRRRF